MPSWPSDPHEIFPNLKRVHIDLTHDMVMAIMQGKDIALTTMDASITYRSPFKDILISREELYELRQAAASNLPANSMAMRHPSRKTEVFHVNPRYLDIGD